MHCMMSCPKGCTCNKVSSLISVTHLCVHRLSGDSMRDEGSLVKHVGRVCILPKVDRGMVSRPAKVMICALLAQYHAITVYKSMALHTSSSEAYSCWTVVGALLTQSRP